MEGDGDALSEEGYNAVSHTGETPRQILAGGRRACCYCGRTLVLCLCRIVFLAVSCELFAAGITETVEFGMRLLQISTRDR